VTDDVIRKNPAKPRNRFEIVKKESLPEWRGRPEEGFTDLALVAAMIESGEIGETVDIPTI
jgi:hypothetical protein